MHCSHLMSLQWNEVLTKKSKPKLCTEISTTMPWLISELFHASTTTSFLNEGMSVSHKTDVHHSTFMPRVSLPPTQILILCSSKTNKMPKLLLLSAGPSLHVLTEELRGEALSRRKGPCLYRTWVLCVPVWSVNRCGIQVGWFPLLLAPRLAYLSSLRIFWASLNGLSNWLSYKIIFQLVSFSSIKSTSILSTAIAAKAG
jgi:hypothetical protein